MMKKAIALILLVILLCACGTGQQASTQPTQSQQPAQSEADRQLLASRREIAESYMRSIVSMVWRAQEDIFYTLEDDGAPEEASESHRISIKAGRLYQGMPYSFAGGTAASFLEFAGQPDDRGIYTVSGLTWEAVGGNSNSGARIGNDCSGAMMQAWGQVGNSFTFTTTKKMTANYGYIPVGEYNSDRSENRNTDDVCRSNGRQVMYQAYAQLQKADGIVKYTGSGHCRMAVSVKVVYAEDGTINGGASTVTVLEQTRTRITSTNDEKRRRYDGELGEYVYLIGGVDVTYSFAKLFDDGYLPITIQELVNPKAAAQAYVKDSLSQYCYDTILSGRLTSNWIIDAVTVTVTTPEGQTVQQATASADRGKKIGREYAFEMVKFETDKPATIRGDVDLSLLPPGTYRCKVECRLSKDALVVPVRDFEFSIK